jgi:hypothetical protein
LALPKEEVLDHLPNHLDRGLHFLEASEAVFATAAGNAAGGYSLRHQESVFATAVDAVLAAVHFLGRHRRIDLHVNFFVSTARGRPNV